MARRTLQTAADVLGLSSSDRAAVGGWTGKETAGTVGQAARRLRMLLRYSGIGATSALVVKAHIIQDVSRIWEQGAPTSANWDHVAVLFPRLSGLRKLQKDNVLTSKQLVTPIERLVSVSSSASSTVGCGFMDRRHQPWYTFSRGCSLVHYQTFFGEHFWARCSIGDCIGTSVVCKVP